MKKLNDFDARRFANLSISEQLTILNSFNITSTSSTNKKQEEYSPCPTPQPSHYQNFEQFTLNNSQRSHNSQQLDQAVYGLGGALEVLS